MEQSAPLPPPLPNDGSLNTELPLGQPVVNKAPYNKRLGLIAVLGLFAAVGLFYTISSYPQGSKASEKNKQLEKIRAMQQKVASPTAVITQTDEQEVDAVDLGDVDAELRDIDKDLNSL